MRSSTTETYAHFGNKQQHCVKRKQDMSACCISNLQNELQRCENMAVCLVEWFKVDRIILKINK